MTTSDIFCLDSNYGHSMSTNQLLSLKVLESYFSFYF